MTHDTSTIRAGLLPETGSLRNALHVAGLTAPHTGEPFTEAMLLGIGGGLGVGYILREYPKIGRAVIVPGFHHDWQRPLPLLDNVIGRLSLKAEYREAAKREKGEEMLRDTLAEGHVPVAWIDMVRLPYRDLRREKLVGYWGYVLNVYGYDESGTVIVADGGEKSFTVPADLFAELRAQVPSYNHRLLVVEGMGDVDLADAVRAGIRSCLDYLGSGSSALGLPVLEKWAKLVVNDKNRKGWKRVFADGTGLYTALRSLYELVNRCSPRGGNLRGLYGDFLLEASNVLGNDDLKDVAGQYHALDKEWQKFAETAFPDSVPIFKETKELLWKRHEALWTEGDEAGGVAEEVGQRLGELEAETKGSVLMDGAQMDEVFAKVHEGLLRLYKRETECLAMLGNVV